MIFNKDLDVYICTYCGKQLYYYEEMKEHNCKKEPQK